MNRATPLLIFMFCLGTVSWAQDTATIVGTVTDPSGGAIPDAKVTISNPEKGFIRDLVTDRAGAYTAPGLPLGNFVVSCEVPGFEKLVRTGIRLEVGQIQRVDMQLQLGKTTQQISVSGNVPHVQTDTGALSDVIGDTQIADLGLNGRSFIDLYQLVPGAMPSGATSVQNGLFFATTAFNGNRWFANNVEVDGASLVSEAAGGSLLVGLPTIDTISEIQISTANYGAEKGRHSGAQIEVATKSGTKEFHGDAYDFVRNQIFDANDWFINRTIAPPGGAAPKTPLKWNDFGYTLGGPFYIPGHYNTNKSKTFFFWSENWRRYRQGVVINAGTPTLRMRNGDFSECDPTSANFNAVVAAGCVLPTNPATGNPFPEDLVPIDPNADDLLHAYIPLPNNGVDAYTSAPDTTTNWRQDMVRVDQNISDKTTLSLRATNEDWFLEELPPYAGAGVYDTVISRRDQSGQFHELHFTHTFEPNLTSETIFGVTYNCYCLHMALAGPSSPAHSLLKPSNWTVKSLFPQNQPIPLLPGLYLSAGAGAASGLAEDQGDPGSVTQLIPTLTERLAYVVGKHTLKIGAMVQQERLSSPFGAEPQGTMTFSNSSAITSGNSLADLYLARIANYTEGTATVNGVPVGGFGRGHWHYLDFEPYFQDDWRVNHKLTLNLGARYYLSQYLHDTSRPEIVDTDFVPSLYNPALEAQLDSNGNLEPGTGFNYTEFGNGLTECGVHGFPKGCTLVNRATLAPRLGFAYDPTGHGKTAIRGGYGIYYEIDEYDQTDFIGYPPVALAPSGLNIVGFQNIVANAPLGPSSAFSLPNREKWPSIQQYNLGVQRQLSETDLFTLAYVGNLGRHNFRLRNINQVPDGIGTVKVPALAGMQGCDASGNCNAQYLLINNLEPSTFFVPYRGYSSILMGEFTGISNYNGLQASLRHTVGHGLTLQAAYTWSHSLDDITNPYLPSGMGVDDENLSRWYASSDNDRRHVLVMNYVYELPFFKSASNAGVRQVLGGWKISGITSFFSGNPMTIFCGINGLSSGNGGVLVCNPLGPVKIDKHIIDDPQFGPTPGWFDPSVIAQPLLSQLPSNGEPGMFGYGGRNTLTGPGRNNWDTALLKEFQLPWFGREHSTFQFRWETFNTFNHPQWQGATAGCSGATLPGQPCTGPENIGNGEVSSAWPPRQMQFALKLIF